MSALALALADAGFVLLALAMERHARQLGLRPAPRVRPLLRIAGGVLLAGAGAACIVGWGVSIGLVAWCGVLTLAALLLAMALALPARRRIAIALLVLLPLIGGLSRLA
ncbi:MAG: DUF3325 domain-containing protein [Rhodospirillales bacterium]|nr:DUF3325 domain-containing protein [Rhodospirillales bacterium]